MSIGAELIDAIMERDQNRSQRSYMGPSSWKSCDAAMWFNWRRVSGPKEFDALTLRTFELGHTLEDNMVGWLEKAGFTVFNREAELLNKWGRPLGHIDGMVKYKGNFFLLEMKTANGKRFKDMATKGIPDYYYAQIQIYMANSHQLSKHGNKLDQCLYVIFNKDTSELNIMIIPADHTYGEIQTDRMHSIIASDVMPEKEETFKCNFCDHQAVCKGDELPALDCRTCANVSVVDGTFQCSLGRDLELCESHVYHPHLMGLMGYEVESVDADNLAIDYGKFVMAPDKYHKEGKPTFTSAEFVGALKNGFVDDPLGMEIKAEFASRVEFPDGEKELF